MKLTKTRLAIAAAIFLTICLFSAALAWLSGYDFNERGGDVAFGTFMTVLMASALSVISLLDSP